MHSSTRPSSITTACRPVKSCPPWEAPCRSASSSNGPLPRSGRRTAVEDDGNVRFHPRIGDLVVELGNAEELDDRLDDQLRHLKTFYRALLDSGDLRQYDTLDLRYDGQLVASK